MLPTRIAIATTDGISVCDHLARSTAFLILEIQDGAIVSGTFRSRPTDTCGNHAGFLEMLDGANAVICGGIGQGAFAGRPRHRGAGARRPALHR
jgi:predicted Fe-Mo cluster-binding NifX family protein